MAGLWRIDVYSSKGEPLDQYADSRLLSLSLTLPWVGRPSYSATLSHYGGAPLIPPDSLLAFWRREDSPGAPWVRVLTGIHKTASGGLYENGRKGWGSHGYGGEGLLGSRVIAYPAGTAQARKGGGSSTIMLELVRENLGELALASLGRDLDGAIQGLELGLDPLLGPVYRGGFSRANLLDTLLKIHDKSLIEGQPLAFRMVPTDPPGGWLFEVGPFSVSRLPPESPHAYEAEGGAPAPIIFGERWGNVQSMTASLSRINEGNALIALGPGLEEDRLTAVAIDPASAQRTPWAQQEMTLSAPGSDMTLEELEDFAEGGLAGSVARLKVTCQPRQAPGSLLWTDYNIGDLVGVQAWDGWPQEVLKRRVIGAEVVYNVDGESIKVELRDED